MMIDDKGKRFKRIVVSNIFVFLDTSKQSLERRFLATDTLQTVLDYLTIEGFHHEEYKVLSSWPRRDVSISFFEILIFTYLLFYDFNF